MGIRNRLANVAVTGLPSLAGPLLDSVAVGAALATWTMVVYCEKAPSLSKMRAVMPWSPGPSSKARL